MIEYSDGIAEKRKLTPSKGGPGIRANSALNNSINSQNGNNQNPINGTSIIRNT